MSEKLEKLCRLRQHLIDALKRGDYARGTIPNYKEINDPYTFGRVMCSEVELDAELATQLRSDLVDKIVEVHDAILDETIKQVRSYGE